MIGLRYLTLLIFILTFRISTHADSERKSFDLSGDIKDIYKTLREIRKSGGFELVENPDIKHEKETDSLMNVCISCSGFSSLVKTVNKITMKLAKQEDKKNPSSRLVEQVSRLDAIYHYTYDDRAFFQKGKCRRFTHANSGEYEDDLDLSESKIVFSNEIPIRDINALMIFDGKKRTYFYRGRYNEEDIIVRLDIHDESMANITYYKFVAPELSYVSKSEAPKKKSTDKWELWSGEEDTVDKKTEHMNYGLGFSIEHRSSVPTKLTLIKGSSLTSVSDSFAIKTDTELSSKKQVASVALSTTKGDDYAKLELDKDVAEIMIPGRFDILGTGMQLETEYSINTKERQKVSLSLSGEDKATTRIIFERDEFGSNSGSLLRTQNISDKQTVSFQLKSGHSTEDQAWIRYKLSF